MNLDFAQTSPWTVHKSKIVARTAKQDKDGQKFSPRIFENAYLFF